MAWDKQAWRDLHQVMMESHLLIGGVVLGHLPSGKNNYGLSGKRMFKSSEVSRYEKDFATQIRLLLRLTGGLPSRFPIPSKDEKKNVFLALMVKVFFRDYRRDVDTILFCDLLQKCEVIENDRMIRVKIINGVEVDKKNPRVEFRLYRINNELF